MSHPRLLGPRRRLFQWGTALLFLAVPFLRVDGESLLRLDLPTLTLYLGGRRFVIEELYLLLLASLALVFFFLLVTLALGRGWCGWGCPQTALTDLAEWAARRLGARVQAGKIVASRWQQAALHGFLALLALLVAANLLWYFISPADFFTGLMAGILPSAALWALALLAVPLYIDLALVRRLLCREFCPYGRFQAALIDAGTLTLRFHPDEAHRCIGCGACVRACPTGIDIRLGEQIECINCGRCLDACRQVMAPRNQPGIIRYTFGLQGRGWRALLNGRVALLSALLVASGLALVVTVSVRAPAELKMSRPVAAPMRLLADGSAVNLFSAVVINRQRRQVTVSLTASQGSNGAIPLLGPVREMALAPGERRQVDFSIVLPAGRPAGPILLRLHDAEGRLVASAEAQLLCAPLEGKRP
ncbi:MAG: 4Fe-4S binding protein [Desulfuromonadales bacterium]|nr:4Fe-4S binding protein [Desulfuromonadales bacterium]